MSQNGDKLLRVDQVARRLGVTRQHVHRLIRQGKLEWRKLTERGTRVPESALEKFSRRVSRRLQRRIQQSLPPQIDLFDGEKQL